MRATLISVDFVKDSVGNYRFVEMNTDTSATDNFINNKLDWSELITFIKRGVWANDTIENHIDTVVVIFKEEIHRGFVNSLSQSLYVDTPGQITTWIEESEDIETIYPTTVPDAFNKLIIRMAYDENAILDSTYAKNSSNALELFVDNDDSDSCINFYYSSSEDGVYDTIDKSTNPSPFPDFVGKYTNPGQSVFFGNLPHVSDSATTEDRWNMMIEQNNNSSSNDESYIQNFHINSDNIADGVSQSLRQYYLVYGDHLHLFNLGSVVLNASFGIPSASVIDDQLAEYNVLDDSPKMYPSKHYYEFSTSVPKENRINMDGVYETEKFVSASGENVEAVNIPTGSLLKTVHIAGMPDTDISSEYLQFSFEGSELPSGSSITESVVTSVNFQEMATNTLFEVTLEDGDKKYFGEGAAVLSYNSSSNETRFTVVNSLDAGDNYFVNASGSLIDITSVKQLILHEPTGSYIKIDVESTDTLLTDGGYFSVVVHNACFVEGTVISLSNGDSKNIENIIEGDEVLSYNEETKEIESNLVLSTQQPFHSNLVKYKLSDGTELICTHDHPFYIHCDSKDLASFKPGKTNSRYNSITDRVSLIEVGDNLYNSNLEPVSIESIEDMSGDRIKTYIFEVNNNNNFFANNILVHNKNPGIQ